MQHLVNLFLKCAIQIKLVIAIIYDIKDIEVHVNVLGSADVNDRNLNASINT